MTTNPLEETPDAQVRRWTGLFDSMASSYDQGGVPFFGPIAAGLVERLAPAPGERALDLGSGRGAAALRLAEAVGPTGRVDGIDVSAEMVRLGTEDARARGLTHMHLLVGDAREPAVGTGLAAGSYDVVASSLVLFFLPDPGAAVARWLEMLRPGGRFGVATFRPSPPSWQEVVDVFRAHAHETNSRPAAEVPELFDDDDAVAGLVKEAGGREVRTERLLLDVPFDDVEQWRHWSLGTALRGWWQRCAEGEHPAILREVAEVLERHRGDDGRAHLEVDVRYTLAVGGGAS